MKLDYYTANVIQYKRPDGHQILAGIELPMNTHGAYLDMEKHDCRLAAEVLTTGHVSVTIEDPIKGEDLDIEVMPNGPEVQKGMITMLNRRRWHNPGLT